MIAGLRAPPLESEVGDHVQQGQHSFPRAPSSFARDLQVQILQNSEIGDHVMNYDIKKSGERIHQLRIRAGYTQGELASKLNIDRSFLSHVESGKKGCSVDLLVQLSNLFSVSLDYLALGKDKLSTKERIEELIADLTLFMESLDTICD